MVKVKIQPKIFNTGGHGVSRGNPIFYKTSRHRGPDSGEQILRLRMIVFQPIIARSG